MQTGLFGSASLILSILVFFVLQLLFFEGGYRFGIWRKRVQGQEAKVAETMVAGIFGLLTFVLVFTFNIAANRFEVRKQNVVNDANAIKTAFLKADLISEPQRSDIKSALISYTDLRMNVGPGKDQQVLLNRLSAMQTAMWKDLAALVAREKNPLNNALASALNTVYDLHNKRIYDSIYNRIGTNTWSIITLISVLSFMMLGLRAGFAENKSYVTLLPFVLAISAMVYLVGDLDTPQEGLFRVTQQPMLDALATMHSYDAAPLLPSGN